RTRGVSGRLAHRGGDDRLTAAHVGEKASFRAVRCVNVSLGRTPRAVGLTSLPGSCTVTFIEPSPSGLAPPCCSVCSSPYSAEEQRLWLERGRWHWGSTRTPASALRPGSAPRAPTSTARRH